MPQSRNSAERNSTEIDELLERSDTVFKQTLLAIEAPTVESLDAACEMLDEIIESTERFTKRKRAAIDEQEVNRITSSTHSLVDLSRKVVSQLQDSERSTRRTIASSYQHIREMRNVIQPSDDRTLTLGDGS